MRAYGIGLRALAPWGDLLKILIAAALAASVIATSLWTDMMGIVGVVLGGALYLVAFASLLALLRVREALAIVRLLRAAPMFVSRRLQQ